MGRLEWREIEAIRFLTADWRVARGLDREHHPNKKRVDFMMRFQPARASNRAPPRQRASVSYVVGASVPVSAHAFSTPIRTFALMVDRHHLGRPARIRRDQGSLHRCIDRALSDPNRADRWDRGGGRVRDRAPRRLSAARDTRALRRPRRTPAMLRRPRR